MKVSKKDMILLSAYLDGELMPRAKSKFEKKLETSPELQQKLEEMQKYQDLIRSTDTAGPAPFLEDAVMYKLEQIAEDEPSQKKLVLTYGGIAAGILALIVLLLITNINNKSNNLSAMSVLKGFDPVYANGITNEDVFNFALYNRLPLDKKKSHFLELGSGDAGEEFVQVKQYTDTFSSANLYSYYKAMGFSEEQTKQLDSILGIYAEMLRQKAIFQKDNKLALNANIWNLNNALTTQLMQFSINANEDQFQKFVPYYTASSGNESIDKYNPMVNINPDDPFLILTIDTLFVKPFEINISLLHESSDSLEKQIRNLKNHLKQNLVTYNEQKLVPISAKNDTTALSNLFLDRDSNILYLKFPNAVLQLDLDQDIEKLKVQLKELHRQMKYLNLEINVDSLQFYTIDSLNEKTSNEELYATIDSIISKINSKITTKIESGKKQVQPGLKQNDTIKSKNKNNVVIKADSLTAFAGEGKKK